MSKIPNCNIAVLEYLFKMTTKLILTDKKDYYNREYLCVNGIKFFKSQFVSLGSHKMIVNLYLACKNGLENKSFKNVYTMRHSRKITVSQEMTFESDEHGVNVLKIRDSSYSYNDSHVSCDAEATGENKENIEKLFRYILNCLENDYPWLMEGFEQIVCFNSKKLKHGYVNNKEFDDEILKEFESTYGEKINSDVWRNVDSKTRKDSKLHQIIINQKKEELYPIYVVPKYLIYGMKIELDLDKNEHIKFNEDYAFRIFVNSIMKPIEYWKTIDKTEAYDQIYKFENFITGNVVRNRLKLDTK